MKIRKHKGGLSDSVATMGSIAPRMSAIRDYMKSNADEVFPFTDAELASVKVEKYKSGYDARITGWGSDTYVITYKPETCDSFVPFGFCDDMPSSDMDATTVLREDPTYREREAVARAICAACGDKPDHVGDARGNAFRWQDYLDAADAALAARLAVVREPFGTYVERADGTTEFQRHGSAFSESLEGSKTWTLYDTPDSISNIIARDMALEEAARICDNQAEKARTSPGSARASSCADRIRSKIGTPGVTKKDEE